jgi:hypothetical protein
MPSSTGATGSSAANASGPSSAGTSSSSPVSAGGSTSSQVADAGLPDGGRTCDGSGSATVPGDARWGALPLPATVSGDARVSVLARVMAAGTDGVLGLSTGAAAAFVALPVAVRFSAGGKLEVRDGTGYRATADVTYEPGAWYQLELDVRLGRESYDVRWARCGEPLQPLLTDAAFRSDAQTPQALDTLSLWSQGGALEVADAEVVPGACVPDGCGARCGDQPDGCGNTLACTPCPDASFPPGDGGSGGLPVRVPSHGPNGTHWPDLVPTPFLYDTTTRAVEVACTWEAIAGALSALDDEDAAEGVRVLVQPGTLAGLGEHAPVLADLGSSTWAKRVTVAPRDGYGSVAISGAFSLARVHGVCLAGFRASSGFSMRDCDRAALAWTRLGGYSKFTSATAGSTMTKLELTEVVWPEPATSNGDVLQLASDPGAITGFRLDGVWMAPHYYVSGTQPRPHTDTLQIYRANGGTYANINITLRDAVLFGSNNAALQTGGTDGITFAHVLVVGGQLGKTVYPVTPGGETAEVFCPVNGAGRNWTVADSYFFGDMVLNNPGGLYSDRPFTEVVNGTISRTPTGMVLPQSGAWTTDTNASTYLSQLPPIPDDTSLSRMWGPR